MKQTAVEWLWDMLLKGEFINDPEELCQINLILVERAKQMEKEQMEDVWHDSRVEDFGDDYIGKQISFNDYYNEAFKTKTKNQ